MPRQDDASNVLRDWQLDTSVSGRFDLVPDLLFFVKHIDGRLVHCHSTHRDREFRYTDSDDLYGKENREFFSNARASAFGRRRPSRNKRSQIAELILREHPRLRHRNGVPRANDRSLG